jgi:hypothetical protein
MPASPSLCAFVVEGSSWHFRREAPARVVTMNAAKILTATLTSPLNPTVKSEPSCNRPVVLIPGPSVSSAFRHCLCVHDPARGREARQPWSE